MWYDCCARCLEKFEFNDYIDSKKLDRVVCDFCGKTTRTWTGIFLIAETRKDIPIFFDDHHCGEILTFASQLQSEVSEYLENRILSCIDDVLGKKPPGRYRLSKRELDIILDGFTGNVVFPSKSPVPKNIREGLWKVITFYLAK